MRTFDYTTLKTNLWDSEILSLVASINEFKGKQELYLKIKPDSLDKLIDIAKIQSIEASNKIEGIVTTSPRLKQLYLEKTTPKNRDEEEIMGYRDVLNTIHESYEYIPVRSSIILQFHRDLYKFSQKSFGGKYKITQNEIAETRKDGTVVTIFTPLEPYETPDAMDAISDSFMKTSELELVHPLLLIPIFINDFLCIHPFNDGNGRMSRLLTTLLLYKSGYLVGKYISLESIIEKNKSDYYAALRETQINWIEGDNDPSQFIKYMLRIILSAYKEFENRMNITYEKGSAYEKVNSVVSERVGKFTKNEVMELVPSYGKASIENSLKQLTKDDIITRHGNGKNTFYTKNYQQEEDS